MGNQGLPIETPPAWAPTNPLLGAEQQFLGCYKQLHRSSWLSTPRPLHNEAVSVSQKENSDVKIR